jgi:hypothetical protein
MKKEYGEFKRSGFQPSVNGRPVPQIPYVTGFTNRLTLIEAGVEADASKRECGSRTEDFLPGETVTKI